MKEYTEQLITALKSMEPITKETVLTILHNYYLENDLSDTGEIAEGFANLDIFLRELTLKNYDRIWDTAVRLCSNHERRGFDAGFKIGLSLMAELAPAGQGGDSRF